MPRVVHFEICADDPERAVNFYQSTFGWKIRKWDGPQEYWVIITGNDDEPGINGGMVHRERGKDAMGWHLPTKTRWQWVTRSAPGGPSRGGCRIGRARLWSAISP